MVKTDKEGVISYFKNILKICERTTTGNVSHQMNSIRICYDYIADEMKKQVGEIRIYDNLKSIVDIASKTNPKTLSYNSAIIKGLCELNIQYINEFGLD